jgi:hypothetical protein
MIMVFSLREDVKVDVFFKLLGFSSNFSLPCLLLHLHNGSCYEGSNVAHSK